MQTWIWTFSERSGWEDVKLCEVCGNRADWLRIVWTTYQDTIERFESDCYCTKNAISILSFGDD